MNLTVPFTVLREMTRLDITNAMPVMEAKYANAIGMAQIVLFSVHREMTPTVTMTVVWQTVPSRVTKTGTVKTVPSTAPQKTTLPVTTAVTF